MKDILTRYSDPGGTRTTDSKHAAQSPRKAPESASNGQADAQDHSADKAPIESPQQASGEQRRRARRPAPPEWVVGMMEWFSDELHDNPGLLNSVITRTTNLFQSSGLSEEAFRILMFNARTRVKARGNIQKAAHNNPYQRNRVPYFFAVLESMLAELKAGQDQELRPINSGGQP